MFTQSAVTFVPIPDTQENPELIWNDESREKVCDTVKKLADRLVMVSCV